MKAIILPLATIWAALLSPASGQTYVVKRYECNLVDSSSKMSTQADAMENHCILFNAADTPISVAGTYGKFGYFEGVFKSNSPEAMVSWWETTADETGFTPSTGGAFLTYDFKKLEIKGPFNTVYPSSVNKTEMWQATNCVMKDRSTDMSSTATWQDNMRKYCLLMKPTKKDWSPHMLGVADQAGPFHVQGSESKNMQTLHSTLWTSEMGRNRICMDGLTTRGTYQYKYSEEDSLPKGVRAGDVEDGLYEDTSLKFSSSLGEGFTGIWRATTVQRGARGTQIYRVSYTPEGRFMLAGWFCNTDAKFFRTSCSFETYGLSMATPTLCSAASSISATSISLALFSVLVSFANALAV